MEQTDRKAHWERVYGARRSDEVSWYEPEPTRSLELLADAGVGPEAAVIDVGGGDATLVDALLARGYRRITILDLSGAARARARARLGPRAELVEWREGDVTRADLPRHAYDVWHDRAVFHFLTVAEDRRRYVDAAAEALRPGGTLVIATFAADGPTRCSGLEVARYAPEALAREFSDRFVLVRGFGDVHRTPAGAEQRFTFAVLRRA